MMNKSLRARRRESSGKTFYGFRLLVIRHSGARLFGANPESRAEHRVWIPGSREGARPGMTAQGQKKSRRFRRLLKLITGRRQTEWTGATRCPNRDDLSHIRESLIDRK
jgi:hypothetical protein